jgi:transposase
MDNNRETRSPFFKAKVATEALSGEYTLAQISSRYGVSPSVISRWKKRGMEALLSSFSKLEREGDKGGDSEFTRLYQIAAKREAELNFLRRAVAILESTPKKP